MRTHMPVATLFSPEREPSSALHIDPGVANACGGRPTALIPPTDLDPAPGLEPQPNGGQRDIRRGFSGNSLSSRERRWLWRRCRRAAEHPHQSAERASGTSIASAASAMHARCHPDTSHNQFPFAMIAHAMLPPSATIFALAVSHQAACTASSTPSTTKGAVDKNS